jgi:hypothetical protein
VAAAQTAVDPLHNTQLDKLDDNMLLHVLQSLSVQVRAVPVGSS